MDVTYLTRADWSGGPLGAGQQVPHAQFRGLVAHHTVMVLGDYDHDGIVHGDLDDIVRYMRVLQHARPDLGPEVPYSFVVFEAASPGACIVAEGRGFGVTGAHTAGLNSTRYGVAVAGNTSDRPVTDGMLDGYRWVGRHLDGTPQPTIGHRDVAQTACPGTSLYGRLAEIQPPFTGPIPPPSEVDVDKVVILDDDNNPTGYWWLWLPDNGQLKIHQLTPDPGAPTNWRRAGAKSVHCSITDIHALQQLAGGG